MSFSSACTERWFAADQQVSGDEGEEPLNLADPGRVGRVKCMCNRGCASSHLVTVGCVWGSLGISVMLMML